MLTYAVAMSCFPLWGNVCVWMENFVWLNSKWHFLLGRKTKQTVYSAISSSGEIPTMSEVTGLMDPLKLVLIFTILAFCVRRDNKGRFWINFREHLMKLFLYSRLLCWEISSIPCSQVCRVFQFRWSKSSYEVLRTVRRQIINFNIESVFRIFFFTL